MEQEVTLRRGGAEKRFTLRRLQPADLGDILALQREIVARVARPPVFEPSSADDFLESMRLDILRGLFDGRRLAALNLLIANRDSPRNLCRLCGGDYRACFTFDTVQVHPDYHGWGMQRFFLHAAAELAGAGRAVLATVSPDNPPSLRAFRACGFEPVCRLPLYGGERFLMRKTIASCAAAEDGGGK